MKYKITMKRSYNEIEFIYVYLLDACEFIQEALKHSNGDISLTIEAITEKKEESTDEE